MLQILQVQKNKLLLLFAIVFVATGHILRLPCLTYGNFSVRSEDKVLQGAVLATLFGTSALHCESACSQSIKCKSVNFYSKNGTCQLNRKSKEDPAEELELTPMNGWIYKSTNYDTELNGPKCEQLKPCKDNLICKDTCECPGYQCKRKLTNCLGSYIKGEKISGIYDGTDWRVSYPVYCDMTTSDRMWVVMQRRLYGSANFNRSWYEYQTGFGNLNGSFWLGLEKIHDIAPHSRPAILRIEMRYKDQPDSIRIAEYQSFSIGPVGDHYRVNVFGFTGNATNIMMGHDFSPFSTYDADNDNDAGNCASHIGGGWWLKGCARPDEFIETRDNFDEFLHIVAIKAMDDMLPTAAAESYHHVEMKLSLKDWQRNNNKT